jgi:hypothetical protein
VRIRAHPPVAARCKRGEVRREATVVVEELLWAVATHPVFEDAPVRGIFARGENRNLMRAPCSLDRHAVDFLRPGPPLRRTQHDHRPDRPLVDVLFARPPLILADLVEGRIERRRKLMVDGLRVVTLDEQRPPPAPLEQCTELAFRNPCEHGRVRDLVAVQVQDRQDGAVGAGAQELRSVPARRERPRLRLAVTDDARDQQVGIVERRAERVRERVAELAAFVDRARGLGRGVTRNAARERELAEEDLQTVLVERHMRIELAVRAFEIRIGNHAWSAVAGAGDVDGIEITRADGAVEMHVDEIEAGGRAEMAEQPGLDVLRLERFAQQWIVQEIDLADGEVVRRPPVRVEQLQLRRLERGRRHSSGFHQVRRAARRP